MSRLLKGIGVGAALSVGALTYASIESRLFTVREATVAVLPKGRKALRLLHLSDIHLYPNQHAKLDWLSTLESLKPDLVINTGDNISAAECIDPLLDVLQPLLQRPGAFVMGSNDYFAPKPKNPLRYLRRDARKPFFGQSSPDVRHPVETLIKGFEAGKWLNLTNARDSLTIGGLTIEFCGVDDPHLDYDRYPAPWPAAESSGPTLRLGVTHAPYQRVLNNMLDDSRDLILAGHTHGGQLCIPGIGALTTNCDLDKKRAKGLNVWPQDARMPAPGAAATVGTTFMNVSAGIGTSPYAQVRFACRPEATLLTLVGRP